HHELERLQPQEQRDVELLKRMSALCEASGDIDAAIAHQQRLTELAPSRDADDRLIALLRRTGRVAEADTIAIRWLESERDPAKVLKEIDRLLAEGKADESLRLISRWRDQDSTNWEFLLRDIFARQV